MPRHLTMTDALADYVVRVGTARIHVSGPKYDPLPEGARVRLRVRDGAYTFWSE